MATHYVDIRVAPDPETSAAHLLGALYDRLHLALVQQRADRVGVSFPGYSTAPRTLGNVLRLHGDEQALRQLLLADWLKGVRDHVRLTDIAPVPPEATHRTVQRRQFKTNVERLRRRRMQRKGESQEQVEQAIPATVERRPNLPFVHLRSRSNNQSYCLFIALGTPVSSASPGTFNSHGLSPTSTIPWF